jgi:hypothetical protein
MFEVSIIVCLFLLSVKTVLIQLYYIYIYIYIYIYMSWLRVYRLFNK